MRGRRLYVFLFCSVVTVLFSCRGELRKKPGADMTISPGFHAKLDKVNSLFITTQFDSAEVLLLELMRPENTFMEDYLLYCHQAEIMYYNLLPALASDNLAKAMAMARASGRPELLANCENYYGLFKIIEKKPEEANRHLDRAEKLFPKDSSFDFLVDYHQILANQAEVHLLLGEPDSAIYYTQKAIFYTRHSLRGMALNHWTLGEAWLDKGNFDSAQTHFSQGIKTLKNTHNGDVLHYLYAGLLRMAVKQNHRADALRWMEPGNRDSLIAQSSVLAQTLFFEQANRAAEHFGFTEKLIDLEKKQVYLLRRSREEELASQSKILSKYYQKLEELGRAKETDYERKQDLLRDRFILVLLAIILLAMVLAIFLNLKFFRQKMRLARIQSDAKIALLTKEKELGGIIARNSAIEEERTRISKELHDDIGSSVSSIKIYNNLALKEFDSNPDKSKGLIGKSEEELKKIEENLGDLIWAIYTKNETIQNLIMRMKQYAFDVLTAKDIQAEFHYPYGLNDIKLPIEFRKNILLIFKEFVNNTAKYSGARNFRFEIVFVSGSRIAIRLCDDGVGFDPEYNRMGKGLSNMRDRAKTMGVQFTLHASPGNGTRFEMEYPLPETV